MHPSHQRPLMPSTGLGRDAIRAEDESKAEVVGQGLRDSDTPLQLRDAHA